MLLDQHCHRGVDGLCGSTSVQLTSSGPMKLDDSAHNMSKYNEGQLLRFAMKGSLKDFYNLTGSVIRTPT